jgi:tyrocidine synthetase III
LRVCILGGEAVTADQVAYLHQLNPNLQVCNEYGPTETTVGCVAAIIPRGESRILIGHPIANTHAYILDRDGHPAPIGVPGEICIGGESVGRGYLLRPDLTAERFTPDPGNPGNRIYHTGDIGCWLPDGTMEYLGRGDDQVKIRGHRLELAEVQQVLAGLPGVRDAAVLAHRCDDETELVAYVVGPPETQSLHRRCREVLPIHMVPARIILMDRLPLTKNGKLDRALLLDPTASEPAIQTEITQPRTATESTLVRIWLAVLGPHNIGVRDNFFALGGHSLKAIQVLSRIHQELGRKVALRDLFRFPTIEALAQLIERRDPDAWSRIEPAPPQETYELSYAQRRVWLADRMGASHSLNTPEAIVYRGRINVDALQRALRALIERHESLRTAFIIVNGKPRQKVCPVPELRVRQFDLRGESDPDFRAKEIAQRDAVQPFDLAQPTPMRATLLQLSDERGVFLLTMHHIIGDGWSRRLFYEEFAELYRAFIRNLPNPLRPLSLQYKDYAVWHNACDFAREESYWMQRLTGVPEGVALPFDFSIRQKREFLGASESLRFSPELTNAVRELAQRHGTLTSYVMLTFFKLVLYHMSRQSGDLSR